MTWGDRIKGQPMFDVLALANSRERQGHYVARMEIGDTPGFRNETIHRLIEKHSATSFRYSPSRGEKILTEKVIETQWPHHSAENVVIGPANFLITAALASVTSPGDLILLPDPGFASYKLSADFLGLEIDYYPVYLGGKSFFPDLGKIIETLDRKPKAVIVNNPSNPLGTAFSAEKIDLSLSNFSLQGIQIIYDETYINLVFDETNVHSDKYDAIRLRSFSKEHCAPGLRIGYALGNPDQIQHMSNLMSLTISCVPIFIQLAIADYLGSDEAKTFTSELKSEMKRRHKLFQEKMPSSALKTVPNAAFYALVDTKQLDGEDAFKTFLANNVAVCPGGRFGRNSAKTVRVSLAGRSETFEKDIDMFSSALGKINAN